MRGEQDFIKWLTKESEGSTVWNRIRGGQFSGWNFHIGFTCDNGSVYYDTDTRSFEHRSGILVEVDLDNKLIKIIDPEWKLKPCVADIFEFMKHMEPKFDGLFSDYKVVVPAGSSSYSIDDILGLKKDVEMRGEKITVFEEVFDRPLYHATRLSNWHKIKKDGLKPSWQVEDPQTGGLTSMNPQLQDAVYLSLDLGRAREFAESLSLKYDEPAVVIRVDGNAIRDHSKLIPDEDAFRYSFGSGGDIDWGIDSFDIESMEDLFYSISREGTFGYTDTIPPSALAIEEEVDAR